MALKNKKTISNENQPASGQIRQIQSTPQNQILMALDTLGAKLVRSETDRETMKRLLDEAMEAQDRLETQIERSHIHIQRRIDQLGEGHDVPDDLQQMLDEQSKLLSDSRLAITDHETRQIRVEDKLNDSKQTIAKLQRRLDSQEQKRAKLQRRIERVENIASEAQDALAAKSLVLLTDQSRHVAALPHIDATAPMQALNDLHDIHPVTQKSFPIGGLLMGCLLLMALISGWLIATMMQSPDKAFVVLQDGTLAQIDVRDGVAQQIDFQSMLSQPNVNIQSAVTPTLNSGIEDELALLSTDWITQDMIDEVMNDAEFDLNVIDSNPELVNGNPQSKPVLNIDRDASLPANIQDLERQALEGLAEAQHDLGALYTAGQAGVSQNYDKAVLWFKAAAEQGIANAAYNLGVLNHQGLGQDQNMNRALDWYRRAAQLGHPEAQYNLGIAYIEGIGTRYNPNMAAAFFQQAALGGIAEAAYNLGLILENGLLGEVRLNDAMLWYRGAAENGSIDAKQGLSALSARLDLPEDKAGYLTDGTSLAPYISKPESITSKIENVPANVQNDINLGSLVPTQNQIIVAQIQEQLRRMDYYNGPQDGIVGAGTVQSIKSYQIREGLPSDGLANQALLTYMLSNGTND